MLKVTNLKIVYVVLILLETFQIVRSSLPERNFFRNIVYIIIINIKVENIQKYLCVIETNMNEGRSKMFYRSTTLDPYDQIRSFDFFGYKCGFNESGIIFKIYEQDNLQNLTFLEFPQSGNDEITLNDFSDNSIVFQQRNVVLQKGIKAFVPVIFTQSIAIKITINSYDSDERYIQYILVSSNSGLNIKKVSLEHASPNLLGNSNPIIVTKQFSTYDHKVIVFFATDLNDKSISYTLTEQFECNADNFKKAIADSSLEPNQIQDAIGLIGLKFDCLIYDRSDDITRTNDPCPETPNNPHYIQINPEGIHVAVYNSTWRTSVCYKIGNYCLNFFKFLFIFTHS